MVRELADSPAVAVRQLRQGFAQKLEDRGINNVFRQINGKWELVWTRKDGEWTPVHEDRYYDHDKQTGENID